MENTNYALLKEELYKEFPGIKNFIDEAKDKLSCHIIELLTNWENKELNFISTLLSFKLKLVIDNNILFAEIRGLIKGNKDVENCFFHQLALHPSVEFFAPPFLKEEIYRKIDEKFDRKDKKRANLFAKKLLEVIKLQDAYWVEDWVKAKRKIGHRDPDDIPYLALSFDLNSHGVMSNDKIFSEEQKDVKAWSIKDTGKITASFNEGAISFYFLGHIPSLANIVYLSISSIFVAIYQALKDFVIATTSLISGSIHAIAKIPPPILLALGIPSLLLYIFDENKRASVNYFIKKIGKRVINFVKKIKEWLLLAKDLFIKIYTYLKPIALNVTKIIGLLIVNYQATINMIDNLEENNLPLASNTELF